MFSLTRLTAKASARVPPRSRDIPERWRSRGRAASQDRYDAIRPDPHEAAFKELVQGNAGEPTTE
jgi:hypothetical protein